MAADRLHFDRFVLDPANRRLTGDGAPIHLNNRYFDALALLAAEAGQLVTKDRFMAEVWRGVPVTDEALTQCIRTLRRVLGDDAGAPRFIATVPKHGYRFVATTGTVGVDATAQPAVGAPTPGWSRLVSLAAGGTVGGGVAGAVVGLFYGLAASVQPSQPGVGAASIMLVLLCLGIAAGLIAGIGVAGGIAATAMLHERRWWHSAVGGALGGLAMGTAARLIGLDAFALLLGHGPRDMTGALEGTLSGAAAGLALWLGGERLRRSVWLAIGFGGAVGAILPLLGGRLMGRSLDLLAGSRLSLDRIGAWFGEDRFGPISQSLTGAFESGAFVTGVVAALVLARRSVR